MAEPADLLAYNNTEAFRVILDTIMNCTLKGISMPSQMVCRQANISFFIWTSHSHSLTFPFIYFFTWILFPDFHYPKKQPRAAGPILTNVRPAGRDCPPPPFGRRGLPAATHSVTAASCPSCPQRHPLQCSTGEAIISTSAPILTLHSFIFCTTWWSVGRVKWIFYCYKFYEL